MTRCIGWKSHPDSSVSGEPRQMGEFRKQPSNLSRAPMGHDRASSLRQINQTTNNKLRRTVRLTVGYLGVASRWGTWNYALTAAHSIGSCRLEANTDRGKDNHEFMKWMSVSVSNEEMCLCCICEFFNRAFMALHNEVLKRSGYS